VSTCSVWRFMNKSKMLYYTHDISLQNLWIILVKPPLCAKNYELNLQMQPKKNHATALCYALVRPPTTFLGGIKYSRNIITGVIHFLGYSYPRASILFSSDICTPPIHNLAMWSGYKHPREICTEGTITLGKSYIPGCTDIWRYRIPVTPPQTWHPYLLGLV